MSTDSWVIVYTGGAADTGVLRDLLEAAGIPAVLGNEVMGTMAPYLVAGGAIAAIKVLVPEHRLEAARAIVSGFAPQATEPPPSAAPAFEPWECPCCHEQNDGTFDICWNCQSEKSAQGLQEREVIQTSDEERLTAQDRFVAKLARRKPLLGTLLTLPAPELAEVAAAAGFDWLFVDMEHGLVDFAAAQRIVQAANHLCPCIVRVPNNEPIVIAKALDTGAAGIIVPHVNTADEARAIVRAAHYPPAGARSLGVARAQGYGRRIAAAIAGDNDRTLVVAQVEHIDAVAHIGEIVAVLGVSAVFIGPFDLSASLGKPGEIDAPDVQEAIATVVAACAARPLPCGIFVVTGDAAHRAFAAGHSLVCAMTDTMLFADAVGRLLAAAFQEGGDARG